MNSSKSRLSLVLLSAALCVTSVHAQTGPWTGPFDAPRNRIDYVTGNIYVGTTGFSNPVIRADFVDMGDTGRVITLHAFAGTPPNGVRTTAIWGETNNPMGRALQGFNFATTGAGTAIWGETASANGQGLRARATSLTGPTIGAKGDVASPDGAGFVGFATATTGFGIGVWGDTRSATGYAGYFTGGRNYFEGNVGIGTASNSAVGSPQLKVLGNTEIVGNLSKTGGTWKIDHPLDPANKYLYHSFVESPDMMNIYNGNITTDAEGYAVVTMPDWFSALNTDFRYQLTMIDGNAPDIFTIRVKEKMRKDNTFVIKTFPGNLEVSWMVTGVRQDAWANKNRVVVEVDKGENRGTYLHPEVIFTEAELRAHPALREGFTRPRSVPVDPETDRMPLKSATSSVLSSQR